jgi:hypothetical protein
MTLPLYFDAEYMSGTQRLARRLVAISNGDNGQLKHWTKPNDGDKVPHGATTPKDAW